MNRTEHYGLPQWEEQDRILRTDFNAANAAVDAALHALGEGAAALRADTWKKEETLAAATCLLYGLAAGAAPDAALAKLAAALPWTLVQEYRAAGAYTWTAPDLFGGKPYRIGVYMVGGGGSGAAGGAWSSQEDDASGGAAGYGNNVELTVTPGQEIPAVVGTGGAAVSGRGTTGNAGGTTSFNGATALGGSGGRWSGGGGPGADGGQGSDPSTPFRSASVAIYGSCPTVQGGRAAGGLSQSPRESQNRFDPGMISLCAGGAARSGAAQTIKAMPDGTKGGDGKRGKGITAPSATGNGNGGGASYEETTTGSSRSGAGSPGMILIYAKAV